MHPLSLPNWLALVLALLCLGWSLPAADEDSDKEDGAKKSEEETESYAERVEDCEILPGLFPLYQDRETGKILMEVSPEQLSTPGKKKEFIHFSHTLDGVTELGLFRGQFSRSKVFTIRRHFERLEFVAENTAFHFQPDSALQRAEKANISEAILASEKIEAEDEETGRLLVEANEIFLDEFFRQLKPGKKKDDKEDRFRLGDLSEDRTRFLETKNFPDNTLFRVQYVFENLHPSKKGEEDVTDSRFVTIKVQHTLIAMPENDYEPRFDDPRVGYFTTQVTDLTSQASAPYRDFIHRWRLVKKNPKAKKSDPVEPITWWIENTTPVELRDTIREAGLAWNRAFESAGFTNAVEIKVQPDDADWDADDIRYHVLRWTSSPNPPFGGYGPSFVNPRTGQILGADIMLEYVFVTNRIRYREIVNLGAEADTSRARMLLAGGSRGHFCSYGSCLHANRIAAGSILRAQAARFGNGPVDLDDLVQQALADLILHEIGHTLGLNHNFRSSHLYDREQIHDTELTSETGLTGSVMDYSPINLALDPEKQGHYYSTVPGPYDHWAIRYGYADSDELETILSESTLPEHVFANDADDMRSTGRGIDPRAMINDLTSEPIEHAVDQITLVNQTLPKLSEQFPVDGESSHELRTAFSTLMREYERAAQTMSRFVGGVYVERAMHGQEGAPENPFRPVPAETQDRAMAMLGEHVFGPDAFALPADLVARLQLQRRGFDFFDLEENEDPKIHDRVFEIQDGVLDHLLHERTLTRLLDSALYGNGYSISRLFRSLDEAIMTGDADNRPNSFREELQLDYIRRLIRISGLEGDSKHPGAAQSQAVLLLEDHLASMKDMANPYPARQRAHLTRLIGNALESR